jgi:hypothetical protein
MNSNHRMTDKTIMLSDLPHITDFHVRAEIPLRYIAAFGLTPTTFTLFGTPLHQRE